MAITPVGPDTGKLIAQASRVLSQSGFVVCLINWMVITKLNENPVYCSQGCPWFPFLKPCGVPKWHIKASSEHILPSIPNPSLCRSWDRAHIHPSILSEALWSTFLVNLSTVVSTSFRHTEDRILGKRANLDTSDLSNELGEAGEGRESKRPRLSNDSMSLDQRVNASFSRLLSWSQPS
jgi:hypothetical protein